MTTLLGVLYLLFAHWVADFLCQTTYMGTMKSKSNFVLLTHTLTYTTVMFIFSVFLLTLSIENLFIFAAVNFVFHTAQDWVTSRLTGIQFEKKIYNGWTGGFTIIGFDQFLHYCQIFITYYLLTKTN